MTDSETGAITIYTDGACSGNPGPGGWGAVMLAGDHKRELAGGEAGTTNNRMELMGAIMALEALKRRSSVDLYTDSTYVRQGISQWIHNWKRNGWKTADKKDVKNADLWQRLDKARLAHDIRWHWVKGHAGHPLNERADELARQGLKQARNGEPVSDTVIAEPDAGTPPAPAPAPVAVAARAAPLPSSFTLDPRLAADTIEVGAFELCRVLLMNERRYPWLILVPMRDRLIEIADLTDADSQQLMREIRQAAHVLGALFAFDKVNVGSLGNIVPQLHVHVIARKRFDPAWPGPVWGHSPVERYPAEALAVLRERIATALRAA